MLRFAFVVSFFSFLAPECDHPDGQKSVSLVSSEPPDSMREGAASLSACRKGIPWGECGEGGVVHVVFVFKINL